MSTMITENFEARSAAFALRREVRQAMVVATSSAKSCRRPPHKTTEAQKRILLAEFEADPNPPAARRDRLAKLLNVERRIIKNWFSNQRALRRKTGQGYRGWATGSASSHSASGSGDELELEPEVKSERASTPAQSSVLVGALTFDEHITDSLRFSPNPELRPSNINILRTANGNNTANADPNGNSNSELSAASFTKPLLPKTTIYREFQPSPLRSASSPITFAPIISNNTNNSINNNSLKSKSKPNPYALPSLLSSMSIPSSWIPSIPSPNPSPIEPSSLNPVSMIVDDDYDDDVSDSEGSSSWSSEVSLCPGYPESALRSSLTTIEI
ncbi:hypothetical protein Clacol_009061 [Clathrus columnatus]|uniref:Homeobox domain-containing protein n=1 Tax=Clathrus columnatus TaxID=1419009 RepID=A0AAV5AMQ6_9AGAM|nr:hypothetical protein Clacol_009061 [Clathrus columnatus]